MTRSGKFRLIYDKMPPLSGALLPEPFLAELASCSQTLAAVMRCVCKSWKEAASAETDGSDYLEVTDKGNYPGTEGMRRFRYLQRILEAVSNPKRSSQVEGVKLKMKDMDVNTLVTACCSVRAGLPRMRGLKLCTNLHQELPLVYLPQYLTHLQFGLDCKQNRSWDLKVVNAMKQLLYLRIKLDSRDSPIETEEDRCYLNGDIKLQNLKVLHMESRLGMQHCHGSLLAPQLSLQRIPVSCEVYIQSILVRRGVGHAQCRRVWGYERIGPCDYCQLIPI